MTSIEFINKEIESIERILSDKDSPFKKDNTFWDTKLMHLQQIKEELINYNALKINYDVAYECLKKQHEEIKQLKEKINEI